MRRSVTLALEILEEFAMHADAVDHETLSGLSSIGYRDDEPSAGARWLASQGESGWDNGDQLFRARADWKAKESRRVVAYYQTPAGIAARARATEAQRAKRIAKRRAA